MGLMDFPRRVYDAMPGGFSGAVNLSLRDGEGPVATRTRDGSYHVAYVRVSESVAEGDVREEVEKLYQESFSDPFRAGMEYQELLAYAPEVPDLPGDPPGLDARRRAYLERDLLERKRELQKENNRYLVEQLDDDLEAFGLKGD